MTTAVDTAPAAARIEDGTLRERARMFQVLGDPTRLIIIRALAASGELHVGVLAAVAGQSHQATSHHLHGMRLAGVVAVRRDGKRRMYALNAAAFAPLARELATLAGA